MDVQDLSNEFSDESDIEETPNKYTKKNSDIEISTHVPRITGQNKPKRGQWIVTFDLDK